MKLYLLKYNNHLSANGYSKEDQEKIYKEQLEDLYNNPRYYLDQVSYMVEYRVFWQNYTLKGPTFLRKGEPL